MISRYPYFSPAKQVTEILGRNACDVVITGLSLSYQLNGRSG
jgi:hypothetical protein